MVNIVETKRERDREMGIRQKSDRGRVEKMIEGEREEKNE